MTIGNLATGTGNVVAPTQWTDLRVAATATKTGGSKDPGFEKFSDDGAGSQGVFAFHFSASTEEEVYFEIQLPHEYAHGTDLCAHVHWSPSANGSAGQKVVWGLEWSLAEIGGVFPATTIETGAAHMPADSALVAKKHYLTEIFEIDGSAIDSMSAMLCCRLFRAATDAADTYTADAVLLEFDLHYQVDAAGSRTEYQK